MTTRVTVLSTVESQFYLMLYSKRSHNQVTSYLTCNKYCDLIG